MTAITFPPALLALEARAWEGIQAGRLTVETAGAVQAGVSAYAAEAGVGRYEVEMGLKRVVRHGGAVEAG